MLLWLLKCLWFKLLMYLIGGWKMAQEQVYDRHRTPTGLIRGGDGRRRAVVTGGNRGIGLEAVKRLLKLGYSVVLGCRDPQKCRSELQRLTAEGELGEDPKYELLDLDLMRMDSVRSFAEKVLEMEGGVDLLINNAGIMFGPRKLTPDGFESQLATNYLGHFLLTHKLLPKLREGGKNGPDRARIVNVSSSAHFAGSWMDLEDLQMEKFYSPEKGYGNSKAAQVLFTLHLNRRLAELGDPVSVYALHPGVVRTGLYQHVGWMTVLMGFLMKTPSQGGDVILHAATGRDIEGKGGAYLENSHTAFTSGFTKDREAQTKLWRKSLELLGLQDI